MKVDYLLIGAGMAGLVLRKFLDGHRVVLIDQNPGSYKIGESVVPEQFQHPFMRALLPAIEKLPSYSPKFGTTFVSDDAVASFPLPKEEAGIAMHVARAELEQLMISEWNIPIRREKVLEIDVARHVVRTDAETYEVEKQVIDCSGPAMVLASMLGDVRSLWPVWARWGYFDVVDNDDARFWAPIRDGRKAYLRYDAVRRRVLKGDEIAGWSPSRSTVLTRAADGVWTWQIPLHDSKVLSFGVVSRHGPIDEAMYDDVTSRHASPNYTLRARPTNGPGAFDRRYAREGFARRASTAATKDYILLADAYGFADPVYSVGTALAVNKAIELAGVLNERGWDEKLAASWNADADQLLSRAIAGFEFWYSGELLKSEAAANQVRDQFLVGNAFQASAAKHYGTLLNDVSLAGFRDQDRNAADQFAWLAPEAHEATSRVRTLLAMTGNGLEGWTLGAAASRPGGIQLKWIRDDKPELVMDVDFGHSDKAFMRIERFGLTPLETVGGPYPFDHKVAKLFDGVAERMRRRLPKWEGYANEAR